MSVIQDIHDELARLRGKVEQLIAERDAAFERGRLAERAAIVKWLREKAVSAWGADCSGVDETTFAAFAIERGDHN